MKINHNYYLNLAFNLAQINLGKTGLNPSVGCVIVKKNSIISSGITSKGGRPHAEFNALNKDKDFKGADLYVTMEPCTHFGKTPPCTNIIKKKGIKRVFFSFYDNDLRTQKKSKKVLNKKKIKVFNKKTTKFIDFYKSYYSTKKNLTPQIDAKIALSKDYFTINKDSKWITNPSSRKRVHLIRSMYDSILSTAKSINKDNSLLNIRLSGFPQNKPDLIIIDSKLKIKESLKLFKEKNSRKIYLITSVIKKKKINFLKKKKVKIIYFDFKNNFENFNKLFSIFKKKGYNRILVECGLTYLNSLIKYKLISNLFIFQSSTKLGRKGHNYASNSFLKKAKFSNRVNVNLNGDKLYKIRVNRNV